MKKFLSILILFLSVLTIDVYAEELVNIESITCDNIFNGNLIENIGVSNDGLGFKVKDANFHHINDYLECTLKIKNTSNYTLSLDEVNFNKQSDEYVKYELTYDNKNEILKDEVRTYRVKVTYLKEYANDIDLNNKLSIKVSSKEKDAEVENPKTGLPTYTAIIVTVGALGCSLVFLKYKKIGMFKGLSILLFLSIFLPMTVKALVTTVVTLESNIHVSVDKYYNVTINPNGGLFNGSSEIYQEKVLLGTEIDLSDITREGFDFVIWELNGTDTFNGDKITITKETKLKAVWNEKFNLSVDPNGGLYNDDASIYTKVVHGGYELDLSNIKREGYEFSHWILNGKDKYTDKKIVVTGDTTVKAIWIKTYRLTINPAGGLFNDKSEIYSKTLRTGTEVNLSNITRNGYKFSHWLKNGTDTYTEDKITVTEDITLVANWIKTYNVTIDPTGGLFNGKSEVYQETVEIGTEINLSNITRNGYKFVNWLKNDKDIYTENKIIVTGDITLVANWIKTYNVTIKPAGGLYNGKTDVYTATFEIGTEIDLSDIKYDGYEFSHWLKNNKDKYIDSKITITEDTILEAVWLKLYDVTINPTGGLYNGKTETYTATVVTGTEIDLSNITREGYAFSHWLKNGTTNYTETKIEVTENITLEAVWLKKYNLTIDPNGGKFNGKTEVYTAEVTEGTEIDLSNIVKDMYIVDGWTLNENETFNETKITITKDTILVAK